MGFRDFLSRPGMSDALLAFGSQLLAGQGDPAAYGYAAQGFGQALQAGRAQEEERRRREEEAKLQQFLLNRKIKSEDLDEQRAAAAEARRVADFEAEEQSRQELEQRQAAELAAKQQLIDSLPEEARSAASFYVGMDMDDFAPKIEELHAMYDPEFAGELGERRGRLANTDPEFARKAQQDLLDQQNRQRIAASEGQRLANEGRRLDQADRRLEQGGAGGGFNPSAATALSNLGRYYKEAREALEAPSSDLYELPAEEKEKFAWEQAQETASKAFKMAEDLTKQSQPMPPAAAAILTGKGFSPGTPEWERMRIEILDDADNPELFQKAINSISNMSPEEILRSMGIN